MQGRSAARLFKPHRVLLVGALVGIGIWAANSDYDEDECIINGKRIPSHSHECQAAVHRAEYHSD